MLCGCNQIFGLGSTGLGATFFDAPVDAPFTCPASGVLSFKTGLHQVTGMRCRSYTTAPSGLATADCAGSVWPTTDDVYIAVPADTDPDPATAQIVLHAASNASTMIVPEGDQIFITYYPPSSGLVLEKYIASGGGWLRAADPVLPTTFDNNDRFSRPSRGPNRHALHYHSADSMWHELAETSPGTWTEARTHPELAGDATSPRLSADGLRLIASSYSVGGNGFEVPVYASRQNINDAFTPFVQIATAPAAAETPFLSDDCGKLYFGGTAGVQFAEQQ